MRAVRALAAALLILVVAPTPGRSERHSDPQVEAEVIVTGMVRAVDSRIGPGPDWPARHYTIELAVAGVERGPDINPGRVIGLRCWRAAVGHVGLNGQRHIPANGELVRAYLGPPRDGAYEVCYGAGIVSLAPPPGASSGRWYSPALIGVPSGVAGLVAGLLLGRAVGRGAGKRWRGRAGHRETGGTGATG